MANVVNPYSFVPLGTAPARTSLDACYTGPLLTGRLDYTLPADKDDALLLHEYLDYDPENGMAFVADTRWVGFAKGEQ